MEVFVRINSTGSRLLKNEIRHASNAVPFFKLGEELEKSYTHRFRDLWKIFSENEIQRYVFHEFILELCTAIYFQKYTDKRKKLDEILVNYNWKANEINNIKNRFKKIIQWMRSIFTDDMFMNTRFKNKSDFYSLFVVLNDLIENKYVTTNPKDNKISGNVLVDFSKAAQQVASNLKPYDISKPSQGQDNELIQYVIATRQSTDTLINRQFRNDYLQSIVKGFILKKKDDKRIFDKEYKRYIMDKAPSKKAAAKVPEPTKEPRLRETSYL